MVQEEPHQQADTALYIPASFCKRRVVGWAGGRGALTSFEPWISMIGIGTEGNAPNPRSGDPATGEMAAIREASLLCAKPYVIMAPFDMPATNMRLTSTQSLLSRSSNKLLTNSKSSAHVEQSQPFARNPFEFLQPLLGWQLLWHAYPFH